MSRVRQARDVHLAAGLDVLLQYIFDECDTLGIQGGHVCRRVSVEKSFDYRNSLGESGHIRQFCFR